MKRRILVLGGGFAGVECTKRLERYFEKHNDVEVMLVSQDNFLLFTPMLPQVASGMIETRNVTVPIRTVIQKAVFYEGRVKNIDPYHKKVNLWGTRWQSAKTIRYDSLVVAMGSQTNFFGMRDLEKNAYQMKTLNDAVRVRNRIIDMLEQAENKDDNAKTELLTFVVVGAGFAGVETAGEIMDLLLDVIKYYPNVQRRHVNVTILEALPAMLSSFPEKLVRFTHKRLTGHGVTIRLGIVVTGFDGQVLTCKEASKDYDGVGETIRTRTVIWTAGVTPVNTIKRSLFKKAKGRIIVGRTLEVADFPGVFAVGDCAQVTDPETRRPHGATAQIAEAQARTAAYNLYAGYSGREKHDFSYRSRGQMAIIGKRAGIARIGRISVYGLPAWALWRNIYISKIPTWSKRIRVLWDWVADALFDRDIARLKITQKDQDKEYMELDEVDDVW